MEDVKAKEKEKIIGPYPILQNLGKGGMGEVFLVKDPSSGRSVALKRIRSELKDNKIIRERFLREATVASHLSHPSIVPILSIHSESQNIYYTMPYVEGNTLRQTLKETKDRLKAFESEIWGSIPALARVFIQVCEAVAYTHSKGVLHRDLKPENIILGKYGEVMILDWGIADFIQNISKDEPLSLKKPLKGEGLTKPGKITGTLAYMAPERLLGKSSSVQTDIYALGVILYQLLTLELPFQRKTIAAFKKHVSKEELIHPTEMAPYRDIPHQLASVAIKCLAKEELSRYQSVEELISDLKNYIEGRPEWIFLDSLDLNQIEDWQFQENILPAKHIAITQKLDITEWVAVSVSKRSFTENFKIATTLEISPASKGIGILFCIPDIDERTSLEEGYCLWLSSQKKESSKLFKNNVQVFDLPDVYLEKTKKNQIIIEKSENNVKLFLNQTLKLNFTNYLPFAGKHIGVLYKDTNFSLSPLKVFDGSHNVMVNCLAVANAFLSHKLFDLAYQEYGRIAQCFPGRMEGREALFRSGLTLLEKGRHLKKDKYFHLALKEFEKLFRTPGAPLEYLGKSLVYDALNDFEEEAKCLELALRKFPHHPLLALLKEHIIYRMQESSLNNREAAYRIILLSIRNIPDLLKSVETKTLFESLKENREILSFIEKSSNELLQIAIELAFWLKKGPILSEIASQIANKEPFDDTLLANALFALILLEEKQEVEKYLHIESKKIDALKICFKNLKTLALPKALTKAECRSLLLLLQNGLKKGSTPVLKVLDQLKGYTIEKEEKIHFDALEVWCHLLAERPSMAGAVLRKYGAAELTQESSPLHFAYGTWLYLTKGIKASNSYFSAVLEKPYPPTTALASHFLAGRIDQKKGWIERAFWWEKKELHKQLELFYKVVGKRE